MESRETLFARVSLANKLFLTEKAVTLNRSKNDVLEELLNAARLNREFRLIKKDDPKNTFLQNNKEKVKKLRDKRKQRRVKK